MSDNSIFELSNSSNMVDVALNARIEVLEGEIKQLRNELGSVNSTARPFRIEDIASR